ncbi:MAG: hypothetical protein RL748_2429 [Pseudomonadota bacterium]|jgi:CRISPR-associated protein Cmr5
MSHEPARTLEQLRLEYAMQVVLAAKQKLGADFKKYSGRSRSLPAQVMQSGLHQALLFCQAKAEPDYLCLYQQIGDWLCGKVAFSGLLILAGQPDEDVLVRLAKNDMEQYMLATREALALLVHIKRLAKAFEEQTDDEQ